MRPFLSAFSKLKKKDVVCCEVGVFRGGNAKEILEEVDVGTLHLVDHYRPYYAPENQTRVEQEEQDDNKTVAENFLSDHHDKIVWHIKGSVDAAKDFEDDVFDFVYIDATHTYEDLLEDIYSWYFKVKEGGYVAGHDWGYDFIKRAVNEAADRFKVKLSAKSEDWWLHKVHESDD